MAVSMDSEGRCDTFAGAMSATEPHLPELVDTLSKSVKSLSEAARVVKPGHSADSQRATRSSGPLQVVGRLYLGLTAIAAASAGVAGYIDTTMRLAAPSESTLWLRYVAGGAIALGCLVCLWLVRYLSVHRPWALSSPSEFSPDVHSEMLYDVEVEESGDKRSAANAEPAPEFDGRTA